MWCVLQFGIIMKVKNTCRGMLILVKVTRQSAASLKLTLLPK